MKFVSYPKDLRQIAKEGRLALVTVDVPGVSYQGAVTEAKAKHLLEWLMENIFKDEARAAAVTCGHPSHRNPGLITECPECKAAKAGKEKT